MHILELTLSSKPVTITQSCSTTVSFLSLYLKNPNIAYFPHRSGAYGLLRHWGPRRERERKDALLLCMGFTKDDEDGGDDDDCGGMLMVPLGRIC